MKRTRSNEISVNISVRFDIRAVCDREKNGVSNYKRRLLLAETLRIATFRSERCRNLARY